MEGFKEIKIVGIDDGLNRIVDIANKHQAGVCRHARAATVEVSVRHVLFHHLEGFLVWDHDPFTHLIAQRQDA